MGMSLYHTLEYGHESQLNMGMSLYHTLEYGHESQLMIYVNIMPSSKLITVSPMDPLISSCFNQMSGNLAIRQ